MSDKFKISAAHNTLDMTTDKFDVTKALEASLSVRRELEGEIHFLRKQNATLEQQLKTAKPKLYRHLKTGGIYEFITDAEMESNLEDVVVYRSIEHKSVWVRPSKEFYDGRFEEYANNLEGK